MQLCTEQDSSPPTVLMPWARLGWRLEQGDQGFKVTISYAACFRLSYMKSYLKTTTQVNPMFYFPFIVLVMN